MGLTYHEQDAIDARAERDRYREALLAILVHQESIAGNMAPLSAICCMARKALFP